MDRAPTAEQLVNFPVNENPRPSLTIRRQTNGLGQKPERLVWQGPVVRPGRPGPPVVTTGAGGRPGEGSGPDRGAAGEISRQRPPAPIAYHPAANKRPPPGVDPTRPRQRRRRSLPEPSRESRRPRGGTGAAAEGPGRPPTAQQRRTPAPQGSPPPRAMGTLGSAGTPALGGVLGEVQVRAGAAGRSRRAERRRWGRWGRCLILLRHLTASPPARHAETPRLSLDDATTPRERRRSTGGARSPSRGGWWRWRRRCRRC